MSSPGRNAIWLQRLGLVVAGLLVSALIVEVFIRVWASAAAAGRELPSFARDQSVILCIGDSHTWGRGRGYPQRLSEALSKRSDRYQVVNLGVPGTNTAQLRRRLPDQLDRYAPVLIVVWSGINNAWNRSDAEVRSLEDPRSLWQRLSDHSRIARFVRVWQHNRALREAFEPNAAYVAPRRAVRHSKPGFVTHKNALEDAYENRGGAALAGEDLTAATREDMIWIVEQASGHGVPVVLISYGLGANYGSASEGIRAAAEVTGAPVVEAAAIARDLLATGGDEGATIASLYDDTVHPMQPLYDAVGDRVLAIADAMNLLPEAE